MNKYAQVIELELQRAEQCLKAAGLLVNDELYADAVSKAYYACLHAAKAALLTKNIAVSSHRALIVLFGQHLVQTGEVDKVFGQILKKEQEDREASDYDVHEIFDVSRSEQRVVDAGRFIEKMKEVIKKGMED